ncbi:MAG: cellulose binding domain-containing protein [Oscillospiraceae bacterium]|nr:cellulose binding domain-containing protein [Oscillospiraceae bacterium]
MKNMKIYRKIISSFLALIFVVNVSGTLPGVLAENVKIYYHEGYAVEYRVVSEWSGNQNIQVTVTNTSDVPMQNWAVGFDVGGEVSGLYNALVFGKQDSEYILKNAGHNYEILPGSSVNFGYTLSGENFKFPADIKIVSKRLDISGGFDVQYNLEEDWGDRYQAAATITNESAAPIEAWQLSFDANAEIESVWNASLLSGGDGRYLVSFGDDWGRMNIEQGASVTFNFNGNKEPDEEIYLGNFRLTGVVIPLEFGFGEDNEEKDDEDDYEKYKYTPWLPHVEGVLLGYAEIRQNTIVFEWSYKNNDRLFNIYEHLGETQKILIASVENSNVHEHETSLRDYYHFTVETTDNGNTIVSNDIIFYTDEDGSLVYYYIDSDEDGLPDIYEYIFGTDPLNPDTDGDGLTDYEEVNIYGSDPLNADTDGDGLPDGFEAYVLGTDPLKYDTLGEGKSDGNYDFDKDGLTNYQEYLHGTNPWSSDTDGDGLSDSDEIFRYKTDPLNWDTDGDGISDGDEISVRLNPLDTHTFGVHDSEYIFNISIDSNNDIFNIINTSNSPFKLSVDIESAGNAVNSLSVSRSGYTAIVRENNAILGIIPELKYDRGLAVKSMTLKFELEDSALESSLGLPSANAELQGIKRIGIFTYVEELNMLLPVETFYNGNTVSAVVDEVGTYCLVDMEKWASNIANIPSGEYYSESGNDKYEPISISAATTSFSIAENPNSQNPPANIVFRIDTREIMNEQSLTKAKEDVKNISKWALETYSDIKIYIYANGLDTDTFYTTIDEVVEAMNGISSTQGTSMYNFAVETKNIIELCNDDITLIYHIIAADNVLSEINAAKVLSDTVRNNVGKIYISTICVTGKDEIAEYAYASQLANISGGIVYQNSNYTEKVKEHIKSILGDFGIGYKAVIATGYQSVKLDAPITEDYIAAAQDLWQNEHKRNSYSGYADTDSDGLYDFEEINFDLGLITFENGAVKLPTLAECVNHTGKTHIEKGLELLIANGVYEQLENVRIIPIYSDPTHEDGDQDGILDFDEMMVIKGEVLDYEGRNQVFFEGSDNSNTTTTSTSNSTTNNNPPATRARNSLNPTRRETLEIIFQRIHENNTSNDRPITFGANTEGVNISNVLGGTNPVSMDITGNTVSIRANVTFPETYTSRFTANSNQNFYTGSTVRYPANTRVRYIDETEIQYINSNTEVAYPANYGVSYNSGTSVNYPSRSTIFFRDGADVVINNERQNYASGSTETFSDGVTIIYVSETRVVYRNAITANYLNANTSVTYPASNLSVNYPNETAIRHMNDTRISYSADTTVTFTNAAAENDMQTNIIRGIRDNWAGTYNGSLYDFYTGIDEVTVDVIIVPNTSQSVANNSIRICVVNSRLKGNAFADAGRNLIVFSNNISGVTTDGDRAEYLRLMRETAAHEFGHILGLYDAYPSANINQCSVNGITRNLTPYVNLLEVPSDDIMRERIRGANRAFIPRSVSPNNIEMALLYFATGGRQLYVPHSTENATLRLSEAIRTPEMIFTYKEPVPGTNTLRDAYCYVSSDSLRIRQYILNSGTIHSDRNYYSGG